MSNALRLSLGGETHSANCTFADTPKIKFAFVFDYVGDLGEGLRGRILKITYHSSIRVQPERECITLDARLQE